MVISPFLKFHIISVLLQSEETEYRGRSLSEKSVKNPDFSPWFKLYYISTNVFLSDWNKKPWVTLYYVHSPTAQHTHAMQTGQTSRCTLSVCFIDSCELYGKKTSSSAPSQEHGKVAEILCLHGCIRQWFIKLLVLSQRINADQGIKSEISEFLVFCLFWNG